MGSLQLQGTALGNALRELLLADDIQPGHDPSYQTCKTLYLYHPLGLKMAEWPVRMAQSQEREVTIPKSPETRVKDAFLAEWEAIGADKVILQVATLSRIYGVASLAMLADGVGSDKAVDWLDLYKLRLGFSAFDPLNTAGSLVLNQNPNALDFMKVSGNVTVQGQHYHRSRTVVQLNEQPIYLGYTTSAFGYVGRSVYQRALFPLKSFVQTMVTDDMVSRKAGLLILKLKPAGSIVDNIMQAMAGAKRALLRQAQTESVLSVNTEEEVETLNLQNLDGASDKARSHILENIASAADMPAKIVSAETFAEGFGEGSEDAKYVAKYVDRVRRELAPLYAFMTRVVQHRAWNPDFYETIKSEYPSEYARVDYKAALYAWINSFQALWPNLLTEPDSEKAEKDKVKLEAIAKIIDALAPMLDPLNKALLVEWAADNLNDNKMMFQNPLTLDLDALAEWVPPAIGAAGEDDDPGEDGEDGKGEDGGEARARGDSQLLPNILAPARRDALAHQLVTLTRRFADGGDAPGARRAG